MRRLILALSAVLVLTGCGGSGSDEPEAAPTPETVSVTVEIADSKPLTLYRNIDGTRCMATGDSILVAGTPPNVTISDGSGNILATGDGPKEGGTFDSFAGCTIPIEFTDVPAADVYVVKITGSRGFEAERNFSRDGQSDLTFRIDA